MERERVTRISAVAARGGGRACWQRVEITVLVTLVNPPGAGCGGTAGRGTAEMCAEMCVRSEAAASFALSYVGVEPEQILGYNAQDLLHAARRKM